MLWVRRFFVQIFSLLLIMSLVLFALAFSITSSLGKPAKLESWLSQSHLYDHFIDTVVSQSSKSVDQNSDGGTGLQNTVIQAAAKQAFTPELIEQSVNAFINSNYDWLEGNTKAPNFNIDLTTAKQSFASQAALYTQAQLQSLPKCTAAQTAQLGPDTDPLTLTCLPAGTTPAAAAAKVQDQLANSTDFLDKPVITAATLNPDGGKPYYETLQKAPQYYRLARAAPIVLAALLPLLAVIIYYLSLTRRRGLRHLGFLAFNTGILLIATKFIADFVLNKVEAKAFNNANVGELQQSLSSFMGRAESAILGITLWFGVAYAVIGVGLLVFLYVTRSKKTYHHHNSGDSSEAAPVEAEASSTSTNAPVITDIAPRPRGRATGPPPIPSAGKSGSKKTRLIHL